MKTTFFACHKIRQRRAGRQAGGQGGGEREGRQLATLPALLQPKSSQANSMRFAAAAAKASEAKRNTLLLLLLSTSLSASQPEIGSLIISEQNATGPQGESSGRGRGAGEEQAADEVVEAATANDALQHVVARSRCVCVCVAAACAPSLSLSPLSLLCLACFLPLLLPYPLHLGRKCKPFSFYFQPGAA